VLSWKSGVIATDETSFLQQTLWLSNDACYRNGRLLHELYSVMQVTDYAIARRIVDLHCHLEEAVNRIYTAEDIQRYITFARQFKPRVSVSMNV